MDRPVTVTRHVVVPKEYHGPSHDEVVEQRHKHLSHGQYTFYDSPLMLVQGSGQYCFDEKGKSYLDSYSNVCHVGHTHPHVTARITEALGGIVSNTRYLHPTICKYAEKMKSHLPPHLSVCYFTNSGSESNDLAIRMARVFTQRTGIIALQNAYHGTTMSCSGVSPSLSTGNDENHTDFQYCSRDVHLVPSPDPYRGKYRGTDPDCGRKYADEIKHVIDEHPGHIAAFIHEAVQGVAGQVVYPRDFLQRAYKAVRAAGGVTICDEVQTGFGRAGSHFWAFETQGVVPDIVTMGKPIGNGFPLGCVVTTREISLAFDAVQYFNTFGGNPVSCSAGLAVLEVIERERLQDNALSVGAFMMSELSALKRKHRIIGDVRGVGMFIGIELVKDHHTLEPAKEETKILFEVARHYGLLLGKGGVLSNVIRVKPPLCFSMDDAKFFVRTIDEILSNMDHYLQARRESAHQHPEGKPKDVYVAVGSDSTTQREVTSPRKSAQLRLVESDSEVEVPRRLSAVSPRSDSRKRTRSSGDLGSSIPARLSDIVQRSLKQ